MEKNKITFRLNGIRELHYSHIDPLQQAPELIKSNPQLKANFNINYRWNIDQNIIAVVFDFAYIVNIDNEPNEFLKLTVLYEYFVEDLAKIFVVRNNQDFDIDKNLEISIVSIAISTTRGILFEKTKGTFFATAPLPLLNASDYLVSDRIKIKEDDQ